MAISRSVASDLRSHFPAEEVEVIYHGVDLDRFRPASSPEEKSRLRERLRLPVGRPIFLFVGAFDRKGLATLVRAGKSLSQAESPLILAVGEGNHDYYESLAGKERGWLELRKPSKEIELYFRACDSFVLPTYYEPFGLVILEAMASALPVVTTRVAGASELILPGTNGLLIDDPSDANALAAKLNWLLANPAAAARIGASARETAEGRSWEMVAAEFQRVIGPDRFPGGSA